MNFPSFDGLRVYEPYPYALPSDGRFLCVGERHQLLICNRKFPEHELQGWREEVLNLGLMSSPAGACLVVNSFRIGVLPVFLFRGHQAGQLTGPPVPELHVCVAETSPRPVVRALRLLAIDDAFDRALRQSLEDMDKADWPISTHIRWWIDCESKSTPIELAAACTARCAAKDLKPKGPPQDR
jgi:hypothetical protein